MRLFPLKQKPLASYKEGGRQFGAARSGGRKHAGCDLLAPIGTDIVAISDGVVIQPLYLFYLGSYALEVQHDFGVVRYGEIQKGVADQFKKGDSIKAGQVIAKVGKLQGVTASMLHLELYSGTATGQLTDRANIGFQRRKDLIDPTSMLDETLLQLKNAGNV